MKPALSVFGKTIPFAGPDPCDTSFRTNGVRNGTECGTPNPKYEKENLT